MAIPRQPHVCTLIITWSFVVMSQWPSRDGHSVYIMLILFSTAFLYRISLLYAPSAHESQSNWLLEVASVIGCLEKQQWTNRQTQCAGTGRQISPCTRQAQSPHHDGQWENAHSEWQAHSQSWSISWVWPHRHLCSVSIFQPGNLGHEYFPNGFLHSPQPIDQSHTRSSMFTGLQLLSSMVHCQWNVNKKHSPHFELRPSMLDLMSSSSPMSVSSVWISHVPISWSLS